jgi:hypothetical protein
MKAKQGDPLTACKSDPSSNGITAGWNAVAAVGLEAIASPQCGDAGFQANFTTFDQDGKKLNSWVPPLVPYELKFFNSNGTVPTPNDTSFLVASLEKKTTEFHPAVFVVADPVVDYAGGFPQIPDKASFVRVTSASGIVGLVYDSAADAGPGPINFYVAPPNGTFSTKTYPAATTAAVAAWQDKAMLVIPTSSGLTWAVRSANGSELNSGSIAASGVSAVDVVALNDHFIVVSASPKAMSFYRFDINGDTIVAPANPIVLPTQLGKTKLDRFDGSMISAAGARNRVIVTWLNKPGALGEGSSPGGYALFQCDG